MTPYFQHSDHDVHPPHTQQRNFYSFSLPTLLLTVYCFRLKNQSSNQLIRIFYRAMQRKRRLYATASCLSVWPSICDDEVRWSHRLEYVEINFTVD